MGRPSGTERKSTLQLVARATVGAASIAVIGVGLLVIGVTALLGFIASQPQDDEAAVPTRLERAQVTTSIAPGGPPRTGGTVTVGVERLPTTWDPAQERWDTGQLAVVSTVADPLAVLGTDGDVHPELAASLEVAADGRSLDIGLRPGVRFHDGTPLDAAAVARHLEALRASTLWSPVLAPVTSVAVVDQATVRVALDRPWPDLPRLLTGQAGLVVRPGPGGEPVGTGPFQWLVGVPPTLPAGTPVALPRAVEQWRPDQPRLHAVEVHTAPMPELLGVSVGPGPDRSDLAVLTPGLSTPDVGDVPQLLRSSTAPDGLVVVLRDLPQLGDPDARQLVTRALRWSALLVPGGPLPAAEPATDPHADDLGDEDPVDSMRLAEDVERWEADHGPLALTLATAADPVTIADAQRLQEDLAEVGIDVTVTSVDPVALRTAPADLVLVRTTTSAPGAGDPELLTWAGPGAATQDPAGVVLRRRAPVTVVATESVHGIVGARTPEGVERSPVDGGLLPWAAIWRTA